MKKKKKKRKRVLWLLIFFVIGGFYIREQYMMYKLNNVKTSYHERLDKIKIQNQQLKNLVKQSERKDFVENQARAKLGLIKQDEILFIDKDKKK